MVYLWIFLLQTADAEVSKEQIILIAYFIAAILLFAILFVVLFVRFQKRKNELYREGLEQQRRFDEALVNAQQEIQDETLKHVGRELHDNVGQLLAFANMQMNSLVRNVDESQKPKAEEAAKTLKDSLTEVRALSKSLNSDVIYNMGFDKTLANEIERINKSGRLKAILNIEGEKVHFENKKDEIILFRILQEFFSNTIKYAEADTLEVNIKYSEDKLSISANDSGNGFDVNEIEKGSGLINMEKRAELIDAVFHLHSELKKGTKLKLEYPFK